MSRQRIRSSVLESSTEKCPHCGGTGHVRSVSSVALQLLRSLEEMLLKGATHNIIVRTRTEIALYLLNHKRAHLRALEERFRIVITVNADANVGGQVSFLIEKGEQVHSLEQAKALAAQPVAEAPVEDEEADDHIEEEDEEAPEPQGEAVTVVEEARAEGGEHEGGEHEAERDGGRKRRRRRRGRRGGEDRENGRLPQDPAKRAEGAPALGRNGDAGTLEQPPHVTDAEGGHEDAAETDGAAAVGPEGSDESRSEAERRRRRRGRRGGRRNRRGREGGEDAVASENGGASAIAAPVEPEPASAVADFDSRPAVEPAREEQPPPREFAAVPLHENVRPPAASAPEPVHPTPETPRRRSTVREPAPLALAGETPAPEPAHAAPPPQPVITATTESEVDDRPRRSGWWSKRALGKE